MGEGGRRAKEGGGGTGRRRRGEGRRRQGGGSEGGGKGAKKERQLVCVSPHQWAGGGVAVNTHLSTRGWEGGGGGEKGVEGGRGSVHKGGSLFVSSPTYRAGWFS